MFISPAYAQAADGGASFLVQLAPLVLIFVVFYFLLIRPQQKRMKQHQAMLAALKRNDVVVLASGVVGKIVRVEDAEVGVEIAQGVTVKVVRSMVSSVRSRGETAANDAKA